MISNRSTYSYEYECPGCGHWWEIITDKTYFLVKCPKCDHEQSQSSWKISMRIKARWVEVVRDPVTGREVEMDIESPFTAKPAEPEPEPDGMAKQEYAAKVVDGEIVFEGEIKFER